MRQTLEKMGTLGLAVATLVAGLGVGPAAATPADAPTDGPDASDVAAVPSARTKLVFASGARFVAAVPPFSSNGKITNYRWFDSLAAATTAARTWGVADRGDGRFNLFDPVYDPIWCAYHEAAPAADVFASSSKTACEAPEAQFRVEDGKLVSDTGKRFGATADHVAAGTPRSSLAMTTDGGYDFVGTITRPASARYEPSDDSVTVTVQGAQPNARVEIQDGNGENGNGGADSTDGTGAATIGLDAETGALDTVRVKIGDSPWQTIPSGRTAAISGLTLTRQPDGSVTASGRGSGGPSPVIHVSPTRLAADALQTVRANAGQDFSFTLDPAVAALASLYFFSQPEGVRTRVDVPAPIRRPLDATIAVRNHIARTVVVTGTATPGATVTANGIETIATDGRFELSVFLGGQGTGTVPLDVIQVVGGSEHDRQRLAVDFVEGGTLVDVPQPAVTLTRGGTTQIPVVVQNDEDRDRATGTVTFTAPRGSTFPAQTTAPGSWRPGGSGGWQDDPGLALTGGRVDTDGTTLTFDLPERRRPADEQFRYLVTVQTDETAPAGDSTMPYVYEGTSSAGDFRAAGATPTRLEAPVEHVFAVLAPLHDSVVETSTKSVTFSGTAAPGTTVAVMFGDRSIGRVEAVDASGTWSFTASMNYARYAMTVYHRTPGAATAQQPLTVTVRNPVSDLPFRVEAPRDGDVVDAPDKRVTFSGTGQPGGVVSVMNGPRSLGRVDEIPSNGRWSLTAVMSYTDYDLDVYYRAAPTAPVERSGLRVTVAAGATPFTITTPDDSRVTAGTFAVTGTGRPGGLVNVFLGGTSRGTAVVGNDGRWSAPVTLTRPGSYTMTVYYRDSDDDPTADDLPLRLVVTG